MSYEHVFEIIKQAITSAVNLTHFDQNRQPTTKTDVSISFGAEIVKNGTPARFLVKSLTPTDADYYNTEQ